MENRVIKFRAWDQQSKTMHIPMTLGQMFQLGKEQELGFMGLKFKLTFNSLVFMQFTGLHDKNGVEIYEGDIDENLGVCKWDQPTCEYGFENSDGYSCLTASMVHDINIVGSVYTHPHLLEPKKEEKQ